MNTRVSELICEAGCYSIGKKKDTFITIGNCRVPMSQHLKKMNRKTLSIVKSIGEPIFNFFAGVDFTDMIGPVIKGEYYQKNLFMAVHSGGVDYRSRMNILYALLTDSEVSNTTEQDVLGIKLMDLVFLVHCNVPLDDIKTYIDMVTTKGFKFNNSDEDLNDFIIRLYENSKFGEKLLTV